MRLPIFLARTLMLLSLFTAQALAQEAVPDHRYLYSRDMDFYGADLGKLFDTSLEACARACSAQEACVAFTFNQRNNACFPKSAITDRQPYEGALSASKVATERAVLAGAAARQGKLDFLRQRDFDAALSEAARNAARHAFAGETLEELTAAMRSAEQSGATGLALRWAGKAVALSDRADLWAELARLSLRAAAVANKREDQRRLRNLALRAATNGYLRALQPGTQVEALRIMARALEGQNRGRDMIPALRLAQSIAPRDEVGEALEEAIGKYGFRVVDHRVDNNAAAPRICAEFSENLVQAGVDYEPFLRIEGPGLAVTAEDRQLCVDGVSHGQRYGLTLRAGLPAASGEVLHRDVRLQVYVRDRSPSVRFAGRAFVLPRSAEAAIPVETVNASQLDLRLRRVSDRNLVRAIRENYFGRPLSAYEDERFAADLAQEVWTGEAEVQNTLNQDMTTRLPMAEALQGQPPGIYVLSASVPGQDPYDHPAASQWFVLSDLGLSTWAGVDGMHVAVRALSDTAPREGVELSLISRANAVLGRAVTDADGFARFDAGLTRGAGAAQPALLMAETAGDIAFLPLTDPAFDLSDRGVEGRPPAPPMDVFLTTDRGAYRVGETIFATALLRDAEARAIDGVPVTAVLKRPDGVEYARQTGAQARAGGHVFALPLGGAVPRGAWRLDILADTEAAPLASQVVLVEDFLPERIDFDITLPDAPLQLGQTPPVTVAARYLFGAPGADLGIEGETRLRATRSLDGWPGYQFGRHDTGFSRKTAYLDPVKTDAEGQARFPLVLPRLDENPGLPLEIDVVLRVAEGSGRPVERRATKPLQPAQPMIGIKPLFDDVLAEGAEAGFDLIALGPDGAAQPMNIRWTVNRVDRQYQWYQLYGNWEWEPVTRRTRVATGELALGTEPARIAAPTDWGSYELVVERLGGAYAASSVDFAAGWYGGDGSKDTPDRLEMSLDAQSYAVGDTARLRLTAERTGVALISVLSNRVVERRAVPVAEGVNDISLSVTRDWGSGAYVTASVLSGMDASAGLTPARQLGLAHATVEPGARQLAARIEAPQEVDGQAGTFEAAVIVEGLAEGESAYVTLAAVDVGILNLTGFKAPEVSAHFFGQRRLGVELRDLYGRLIDSSNGAMGRVRSGGDAAAAAQIQSPPPTEELMAFFAGPVPVGPDGKARVTIRKPAFNGTIKLMAVVWSESGVGEASADVVAKDPVVLSASLPRFLAPGDESRLLLELTHAAGPAGEVALEVFADAGVALGPVPAKVSLEQGSTARLSLDLTGREIGDQKITLVMTTPDGQSLRNALTLPLRDNDPEIATSRQFALGAGESFTFDRNVFAGLRPGSASATLSAGPLARFDVPGLLRQLDGYPYGCTEQVTSGALPLLYLSSVAEQAGLGAPAQIEAKIGTAIERILSRQASNGAFGLWRAQSGEFWLDAYVTDFLSRARAQGHAVPDLAFRLALDNLRNRISYAPEFDRGGEDIAYALLVLAREGAAAMGDLRYYADTKAQDFATPMAVAQLGAALAAYGDQLRADAMFRRAGAMLVGQSDARRWRVDYGSAFRDSAAVLKLTAEAGSTAVDRASLVSLVQRDGGSLSTQEAAQLVMAAHALAAPGGVPGLRVDGAEVPGPVVKRLRDSDGAASVIENTSDAPMDVTLTTYGVPEVPAEAGGYGYGITREYFSLEGERVEGPVAAGTRLVTVLQVTPFEEVGARLIVDDPLPAGFEIDNPNLLRGGDIAALGWLKPATAETAEFRSDRFVAAVNHRSADPFRLAYIVRAVSPGDFHHPAAIVEDMYRPEYRANTATGRITVTP